MKIIISHDVDHITAWEHKTDLIIPKFIARSLIELSLKYIRLSEFSMRIKEIFTNKWHNLDRLVDFDNKNGIPSTFFFGMANGLGLSYSLEHAELWINQILRQGLHVGVHGIAYNNYEAINREHSLFRETSGLEKFGIRMHYLRNSSDTQYYEERAGYIFDSSFYELKNPYRVGNMWEFPLHIMDTYLFYVNKSPWRNQSLEQVQKRTIEKIKKAFNSGIRYFTILSHDKEFSESFNASKEWYVWVIGWLKDNGFKFIDYTNAILEMNKDYDRIS